MNTVLKLSLAGAVSVALCVAVTHGGEGRRAGDLRVHDRLRVGDPAPDFKLKTKEGDREVRLSSFRGKRPVVLVFGSYT